jgi:hypothetical protein
MLLVLYKPARGRKRDNLYFRLRKAKICPYEDNPGTSAPDEAGISLKIPGVWIHEIVLERAADDTEYVRGVTGEADCFLPNALVNFEGYCMS